MILLGLTLLLGLLMTFDLALKVAGAILLAMGVKKLLEIFGLDWWMKKG